MEQLTKEELAAMWIYSSEYSRQRLGVVEWWKQQPDSRHEDVRRFLRTLAEAPDAR